MTDETPPPIRMSEWAALDPADWPHTPPLEVYRELEKQDGNLFWRMEAGHALNLLDEAIDRLEQVEKVIEDRESDDAGGSVGELIYDLRRALAGEGA